MKRSREGDNAFDNSVTTLAMANYLMMLSRSGGVAYSESRENDRVFECRTCNRVFSSFQALGGHRASHKKPKVNDSNDTSSHCGSLTLTEGSSAVKPKTHECSICGLEFALGQALGGHMRRHRNAMNNGDQQNIVPIVMKKNNNNRRILYFDLNLTPLENDDLEFELRKTALVDFFLC